MERMTNQDPGARGSRGFDYQQQQLRIMRKQLLFSRISMIFMIILVLVIAASAAVIVPKAYGVLKDAKEITEAINPDELEETVQSLNQIAQSSQDGMNAVTDKLNSIDLEGLTTAIKNLSDVMSPMSGFSADR